MHCLEPGSDEITLWKNTIKIHWLWLAETFGVGVCVWGGVSPALLPYTIILQQYVIPTPSLLFLKLIPKFWVLADYPLIRPLTPFMWPPRRNVLSSQHLSHCTEASKPPQKYLIQRQTLRFYDGMSCIHIPLLSRTVTQSCFHARVLESNLRISC